MLRNNCFTTSFETLNGPIENIFYADDFFAYNSFNPKAFEDEKRVIKKIRKRCS